MMGLFGPGLKRALAETIAVCADKWCRMQHCVFGEPRVCARACVISLQNGSEGAKQGHGIVGSTNDVTRAVGGGRDASGI